MWIVRIGNWLRQGLPGLDTRPRRYGVDVRDSGSRGCSSEQMVDVKQSVFLLSAGIVFCLSMIRALPAGADDQSWAVQQWTSPFDYSSATKPLDYSRADPPSRIWNLCISYPHLKDAYWLNVNHGMVEEATRLGVNFTLVEAGGYPNIERQREQIHECTHAGTDALIIGAVSYEALKEDILEIARRMPVLATVNDISDHGITAKSGVSWTEMGEVTGQYLAARHPAGSSPVRVAWFPGPQGAGWVEFIEQGFRRGIANSSVEVVVSKWGDTGKEIQRTLVQEALEEFPDIDYIVGNALTAEAAISILRRAKLDERVGVIATYLTPAVYRGIRRDRILAAPTDSPVLQGRISINQAVNILEQRPYVKHAGPQIKMIDSSNYQTELINESLAPSTFLPSFVVRH